MDNELLHAIKGLLSEELEPIKEKLVSIEDRVTGIEDRVTSLEDNLIRIENNHDKRIAALADGYALVSEKLDDHTRRFERLEKKVDDIGFTVGVHDLKFEQIAK